MSKKSNLQIKKDAKGRFWVVCNGGQEHGPYENKKEATDAKAALGKAKKVKEPKPKKVSAIDAAAQVLATSKEFDLHSVRASDGYAETVGEPWRGNPIAVRLSSNE